MDLSGSRESFGTFDLDCLRLEDCQYILRALEKRAFEYIVCALRAQGPLSQYKEVILDHLKSLLFISDDDFLLRIRLSANDPILTKIAQELNPSYDNVSEWLAAGYSLISLDFPKVVKIGSNTTDKKTISLAAAMQREMAKHNARLDDERGALLKLLQLSKKPYVPEKLRRLLHDTEKDVHGRSDVLKEKVVSKTSTRHVGRPRRAESAGPAHNNNGIDDPKNGKLVHNKYEVNKSAKANLFSTAIGANKVNAASSLSTTTDPQSANTADMAAATLGSVGTSTSLIAENGSFHASQASQQQQSLLYHSKNPTKSDETEFLKMNDEFSIHYSGGANVVIVDPEDQNTIKEPKVRKRRSKLVDDVTCTCARVLPFIFERAVGDMPKPPRGNPDKRCSKLKTAAKRTQLGYSGNSDLISNSYNYVPQQIGITANNFGYSKNLGYMNSELLPTPTKRTRPGEDMDDGRFISNVSNVIYQKPQGQISSRTLTNTYTGTQASRQQHPYYSSSSVGRQFSSSAVNSGLSGAIKATSNDAELINSASDAHYRNAHISQPIQSAVLMTTDASGRLIPQDVQLVEGVPQEIYGNDVYMEQHSLKAEFNEVVEGTIENNGIYLDSPDGVQYVQTVIDKPVGFSNSAPSRVQKPTQVTEQGSSSSTGNYGFGSSGLDFLASTASLLTPMQKQSAQSAPVSSSSSTSNQPQPQVFVSTKPSTTTCTSATTSVIPTKVDPNENYASTGHLQSQGYNNNKQQSQPQQQFSTQEQQQQCIVTTPAGESLITVSLPATSLTIPTASVVYVQNTVTSKPTLLAPAVATETYIVDYGSQTSATPIGQSSSNLAGTSSSSAIIVAGPPVVISNSNSGLAVASTSNNLSSSSSSPSSSQPLQQCRPSISIHGKFSGPKVTTYVPSANSPPISSAPKTFANDNQATQNFLKQHASLVDNNGRPLNEEITLGSILRSSNLRSKLLSAAAVGKSPTSKN